MKNLIKKLILLAGYLFHYNRNSKVIYYHDVDLKYTNMGTSLDIIKGHIDIIRNEGFDIVKEITEPKDQIMICFDDGWSGIYDSKEFFLKENIFPTIFIAIDLIGSKDHLTKEQIFELYDMGFLFEGHSWSHKDLTTFSDEELIHEVQDSKYELEKMFNHTFKSICFPIGRFSDKVIKVCKKSGYTNLFTSICGGYNDLPNSLRCRCLAQSTSINDIKYLIEGSSRIVFKRNINQHYHKSLS